MCRQNSWKLSSALERVICFFKMLAGFTSNRLEWNSKTDPWKVPLLVSAVLELVLSILLFLGAAVAFITSQFVRYFGLDPSCAYAGCSHAHLANLRRLHALVYNDQSSLTGRKLDETGNGLDPPAHIDASRIDYHVDNKSVYLVCELCKSQLGKGAKQDGVSGKLCTHDNMLLLSTEILSPEDDYLYSEDDSNRVCENDTPHYLRDDHNEVSSFITEDNVSVEETASQFKSSNFDSQMECNDSREFNEANLSMLSIGKNANGENETTVKLEKDCANEEEAGAQEQDPHALKEVLQAEFHILDSLEAELEKERNAAQSAASEALAMISRLQAEKSAMQMEIAHMQRLEEEKAEYDRQALELLKEILVRREEEKLALEKEVELYRERFHMHSRSKEGGKMVVQPCGIDAFDLYVDAASNNKGVAVNSQNRCAYRKYHQSNSQIAFFMDEQATEFILEHLRVLEEEICVLRSRDNSDVKCTDRGGVKVQEGLEGDSEGVPMHDVYEVEMSYSKHPQPEDHEIIDLSQEQPPSPSNNYQDMDYHAASKVIVPRNVYCSEDRHIDHQISYMAEGEDSGLETYFGHSAAGYERFAAIEELHRLSLRIQALEEDRELKQRVHTFKHKDRQCNLFQEVSQHVQEF